MCKILKSIFIGSAALAFSADAAEPIEYRADALFGVGNGDLTPYYMSANMVLNLSPVPLQARNTPAVMKISEITRNVLPLFGFNSFMAKSSTDVFTSVQA